MAMNTVILVGNLVADPELKYTQSGKAYAKVRLAVSRNFKNEKGEYEADFINLVAWDKRAELIAEYLRKGQKAGFQGSLRTRTYEDESGQKKTITEVLIEAVEFMDSKKKSGTDSDFGGHTNSDSGKDIDDEFPF